jgi:hypothetical protein
MRFMSLRSAGASYTAISEKSSIDELDACESVPLGKNDERIEARLLKTGRVKEAEIETGRDLSRQDLARPPNLFAMPLEAFGPST